MSADPRSMRAKGFTLTELAVVMTIVAFLLASLMYTLSAQTDQRNYDETRRRLEQARELLLSFAIVNGRLPCPARSAAATVPVIATGDEVRDATGQCSADHGTGAFEDYYGGTNTATGITLGLLPAKAIGFQAVDAAGFAVDAWGNRIRYAVAKSIAVGTCSGAFTNPHWVNAVNMKTNGIACQPGDLLVCKSATGMTATACGGAANQVMTQSLVVAIIFSTGKNGATSNAVGVDEKANVKTTALVPQINPVFVFHPQTGSDFVNGEFDDLMLWVSVGELYAKLIAAGALP